MGGFEGGTERLPAPGSGNSGGGVSSLDGASGHEQQAETDGSISRIPNAGGQDGFGGFGQSFLSDPVGRGQVNNQNDVWTASSFLSDNGFLPSATREATENFHRGIEAAQTRLGELAGGGLQVDGFAKPFGPTEVLAQRAVTAGQFKPPALSQPNSRPISTQIQPRDSLASGIDLDSPGRSMSQQAANVRKLNVREAAGRLAEAKISASLPRPTRQKTLIGIPHSTLGGARLTDPRNLVKKTEFPKLPAAGKSVDRVDHPDQRPPVQVQNLPFDPSKDSPAIIRNLPYIPGEDAEPSFNLLTRVDPIKAASEFRHVATFKPGKFERDAGGNADIQGVKVDAVNADLLEQALKTRDRVELEAFQKKLHRFDNVLTGPQKDFLRGVAENRFEAITDDGFEAMTTEGLKTLGEPKTEELAENLGGKADEPGVLKSNSITIGGKHSDLNELSKKLEAWDAIVDGGITDEAGASHVDEVPDDLQRKVGETLLGILPGTGEAMEAKEAYQAFQAAREALRRGDLSDAGINAALAGVSAAGTVPVLGKAQAYAKKVVRLLARGIDAASDGETFGKAAGAAAIGAAGALMQDTPRDDGRNAGADRAMLDRPFPPPPGYEPPDAPLPDRTESLSKPVELPDLSQPIPETTKPTIFILPVPDEDLQTAGMIVEDRRGNFETKAEIERIQSWIEKFHPEWDHEGGGVNRKDGGLKKEYWIPSVAKTFGGDGRKGGTYVDLSFVTPSGKMIHIQTVDVDSKTGKVTQKELDAADRIRRSDRHVDVILIPKGVQMDKFFKRSKRN